MRFPAAGLTWLVLVASLAFSSASAAHVGQRVFPIYELPTADLPDLHDGTLEDWEEVLPEASLDQFDFQASTSSWEGPDASDLAWRVFIAWHNATQRLFVAVERVDDVFLEDDRSFEFIVFMIDGDHSGGQFEWFSEPEREITEAEIRQNYAQAQAYGPGVPRQEGRLLTGGGSARAWAFDPPWTEAGGATLSESPHDFVLEFAITPWDNLSGEGPEFSRRSALEPGGIIGFQTLMSDSDVLNEPKGQYTIAPALMNEIAHYADNFVDGLLIPCYTGDCSRGKRTAVRENSWGRIKASLR